MKKTKVKGVFTTTGEGFSKEWTFNKEELAKLTNEEFAIEVERDFENMHDPFEFQAEIYYVDYTGDRFEKTNSYYVCLGHSIYTRILIFTPENQSFRKDALNHDYFNNIVKPFMSKIKRKGGL